jgi:hypothetical protein
MKSKILNKTTAFLASGLLVFSVFTALCIPDPAEAATLPCFDGGLGTKSFNVKYTGINNVWSQYFDTARSRWNGAGIGANVEFHSGSANTMTAGNYTGDDWFGVYGLYTGNKTLWLWVSSFTIQINATALVTYAPSTEYDAWALSTSTHELGHAFSLADDPLLSSPNTSLMNHTRDRSLIGSPTAYDKTNVGKCA